MASSEINVCEVDLPLHTIGFELQLVSPFEINGKLKITDKCCQPFKVLHGGVSALIAEALASIGAHVASGFSRIAGIQLSINHHRSASLGDVVFASAKPVQVGRTIQVWEVRLWKMANKDSFNKESDILIASSKVTLLSNMPIPKNAENADVALRKYAKL